MATTEYGVNATKRDVTVPAEKINVNEEGGRMRVKYDSFTSTGVLTVDSVINLMTLPAGAKVYNAVMRADDFGTTGDFDLGWAASSDGVEAADEDGFLAAADVNAAAAIYSLQEDGFARPGFLKSFAAEVQVQIHVDEATTAAGEVEVAIYYSLD